MNPERIPSPAGPLSRRQVLRGLAGAGAALLGAPMISRGSYALGGSPLRRYSARALELVGRSLVIDMLSPFAVDDSQHLAWMQHPERFGPAQLREFRDSGINVFHIGIGVDGNSPYTDVLKFFAAWNGFIAHHDRHLMRVDDAEGLARVKGSGKIGVLLGLQDSTHFTQPADVDFFHALGQRVSQLTYNARNLIGNGSTERRDDGISDFGAAIIARMNAVGMAVDVSHCGDRTTLDAFELSRRPVLITHSNCRALNPGHPRCKTDEAIRKMAATGGVMGITGVRNFVKATEPTTIEDVLDQFVHVRKLVGPEHLGVGSDMDLHGYDALPPETGKQLRAGYKGSYAFRDKIDIEGLDHPRRIFDLTEGLIRRKFSAAEIEGVLGGNFRRVLTEIWKA